MLIQVGGFGGHRKGTLLAIFTRQPYRSVESHSTAPALGYLSAMNACSGHWVFTMGFRADVPWASGFMLI